MKVTSQSTLVRVALTVLVSSAAGFAYGVVQTIRPTGEAVSIPLPSAQTKLLNLDAVPKAAPIDPASANAAIDPSASKLVLRKSADEEDAADDQDADKPQSSSDHEAPAADLPSPTPAAPKESTPAPTQHGPF